MEKGTTARKYENASMWMNEAGITYNCFNVTALDVSFTFNEKRNLYKLYMLDTGLLCALGYIGIQSALLMGNINVNEGGITENAIASSLAKKNIPLYYYDKKSRLELDFLFIENGKLSIIEVKSGKEYKKHASIDHAYETAKRSLNRRIVLSKYNVDKSASGVIYYPLYMAMFL